MSIDKDPEVYKFLVGAVMALVGVLNFVGAAILKTLKSNDEKLFGRANHTDEKLTALVARCDERHRRDK